MIDYTPLWRALADTPLAHWPAALQPLIDAALDPARHGDLPAWAAALARLPENAATRVDLSADCLLAESREAVGIEALTETLMAFHPWRKGPFCLFGLHLDTEWRSDWKWARIAPHLDLRGRRVLDVGCGNGYYGWRMLGAGADLVVGVDPTLRYVMQYAALRRLLGEHPNYVLPLRFEALPEGEGSFDTALSLGVLYHRRDPQEHLGRLRSQLRPGGTLVLEGLVIEGKACEVLEPRGRYAKMKNVHAVPAPETVLGWLEAAGFTATRVIDVTPTTEQEQRRTAWMRFESLADFLDPNDPSRTVEGHPAPRRAVWLAERA